jgi:nucleoid-associated protein YgaU
VLLAQLALVLVACNKVPELEAKPAQPAPAALRQDKPAEPSAPVEPAPPAAAPVAPPSPYEPPEFPKEGWSKLSMRETLPFCLFSGIPEREAALHIEQVKKQTLKADQPVVFGVFGPWCINKECDALPMIECWVDKEGEDTLVLHTHFFSFHKDGSAPCTKDCLAIDTMCSSPDLKPGKYTIKHGDKTYPLQIPSVVKKPCLNAK